MSTEPKFATCGLCEGRHLCVYHEGARGERNRIIAWLRDTWGASKNANDFADAIERGDHA